MSNVAAFFPGLGGALPPAVRTAESPNVGDTRGIHRFSNAQTMVVDPNQSKDVLVVADIAKYPSLKSNHHAGASFVATNDLLAYAVKGGVVRVIHQDSGHRALLKGHSQPLADMAFTGSSLATCGDDGLCILWDIIIQDSELSTLETLRLRSPAGDGMQRVLFHPVDSLLLFIAHGPSVTGMRLSQQVWEIYRDFPNKEAGMPLEQVASFAVGGVHTQTVNDMAFSEDGRLLVTAGNDGAVVISALDASRDGSVRVLQRIDLGRPVTFVSFAGGNVVCGFVHMEEMLMIALKTGAELSRIRFATSVPGTAVRMRAQAAPNGRAIVLCDTNSPAAVVVHLDQSGFKSAISLKVPSAILSFSLVQSPNQDSLVINAVGEALIQTLTLPSISSILPMDSRSTTPALIIPDGARSTPQPVPLPPVQMSQATGMLPRQPSISSQTFSPPQPVSVAPNSQHNIASQDLNRMLDEKLGAFFNVMEAKAKEREEQEHKRMLGLVEAMTSTLASFPPMIQESVVAYFKSPEYAESLAVALKAGLDASNQKLAVDKAVKAALPAAMKELSEVMSQQINLKVQQTMNKAFEDAFRTRLVPAFEAGCRDMMQQFETSLSKKVGSLPATNQGQLQTSILSQIDDAVEKGDLSAALDKAISSGDAAILIGTCEKIELTQLLTNQNGGLSQVVLLKLIEALSQNLTHEPGKCLEWIEMIAAGGLDTSSEDIASVIPAVAQRVKASLLAKTELFAKSSPVRFRSTVFLMNVLESH